MAPVTFCRVCAAGHARVPLYACLGCGAVLCPERTALILTGRHWVRESSGLRICGTIARVPVRSDMTCAVVGRA